MRSVCFGLLILCLPVAAAGALRADDQPDAKPVLEKAVKALGGDAKLAKLRVCTCKGKATSTDNGQEFTVAFDGSWKSLDQYRIDAEAQFNGMSMKLLLVINADKAWAHVNNKTEEAPPNVVPFVRDVLHALRMPQVLPALRDKEYKLAPLGEVRVADRDAVGLQIDHKDHKPVNLFFDKENGLPLKAEVRLTDPQGKDVLVEHFYGDYKEFDGLKHPTKVVIKADGKEVTMTLSEIKPEEKLDDSLFAMP
jgi:hypothetical protein